MKVTINGITYEGTPSEIRDIVENPPDLNGGQHQHIDCPDNDNWNYPRKEPHFPNPRYPWPDSVPSPITTTWWDTSGIQRNWDGSPRVTCTCLSL